MANKPKFNHPVRGNFINGEFVMPSEKNGEWVSKSPGDFNDELGRFPYSYSSVEQAVQSARTAFHPWRRMPFSDRAELLKKYQAVLKRREDDLTEIIAREV